MKKDKEWLKNEINELLPRPLGFSVEKLREEYAVNQDAVLELIDQLDEPETLSEEWIKNHTASADAISYYSEENVPVVTVSNLKGLLVPNQDKPVIPQFVADFIEKWKNEGLTMSEWFEFNYDDEDEDEDKVFKWLYDNDYETNKRRELILIDAIRYGYEVEKEQLYHVVNKENYFMLRKHGGLVNILHVSSSMSRDEYGKDTRFMLTEKEIKDYDERYWAFAEEVTE